MNIEDLEKANQIFNRIKKYESCLDSIEYKIKHSDFYSFQKDIWDSLPNETRKKILVLVREDLKTELENENKNVQDL